MNGLVALGSGGAALTVAFLLYAGIRGNNKIKIKPEHVPYWAFAVGILSAAAGTALSGIGDVGAQVDHAFKQAGGLGEWKTGATAAVLTIAVFGLKARAWKDTLCSAIAPGVYLAAGGLWALPVTILGSLLRALLGA